MLGGSQDMGPTPSPGTPFPVSPQHSGSDRFLCRRLFMLPPHPISEVFVL